MIRGVVVVFGVVAIGLILLGAGVVAIWVADWWQIRKQLRGFRDLH